jgi:hypothetical protein
MLEEMKVKYHTVDADLNCVSNIIEILKGN